MPQRLDQAATMTRRNISAFLLAAAVILTARSAIAEQRRVAIVPFDGDAGPRAQSEVSAALRRRFVVISPSKVARGIKEVGGLRGSSGVHAALARKLQADAVVSGSLARDTKWRLRLAVHDGGTGELIASTVWSGGLLNDVSRTIRGAGRSWLMAQLGSTGNTGDSGSSGNNRSTEPVAAAPAPPPAPREPWARADRDEEKKERRQAPDPEPEPTSKRASSKRTDE